jgi:hypothetical protein
VLPLVLSEVRQSTLRQRPMGDRFALFCESGDGFGEVGKKKR